MTTKQIETLTRENDAHLKELTDRRNNAALYYGVSDDLTKEHIDRMYARVRELEEAIAAFAAVEWRPLDG